MEAGEQLYCRVTLLGFKDTLVSAVSEKIKIVSVAMAGHNGVRKAIKKRPPLIYKRPIGLTMSLSVASFVQKPHSQNDILKSSTSENSKILTCIYY